MVSDYLTCQLQGLYTAHIKTNRWIELKCTSTSSRLWISKHNANLLTQLIDKNYDTIRTADCCCQLTKCLWHKSCLKTHMGITHIAINLCLWNKRCNRIDNHNINSTWANHRLSDFKCLLSIIRLRYVEIININTNISCINRIKCMLSINKACNAASFLNLCNCMKSNSCLTTWFWSVNLNNTTFRQSTKSKCNIKTKGTSRYNLNIHICTRIAQLHNGTLAVSLLNLS